MCQSKAWVMITEGAGFICSHWSDRFLPRGLEVGCVDRPHLQPGRHVNFLV